MLPSNPGGNTRTLLVDAVQVLSNLTHKIAKNEPAVTPIQLEAIYDTTENRFGIMGDS
jgi:hypothetical protein